MREIRQIKAREIRAESADGARYLTGYAACYNELSEDLGGWRERILPGAFTRALSEKQDVCHLVNHDPSLILGRTSAGTTELSEDTKGLRFRTRVGNRNYENDLYESVVRGDVDGSSFAFENVSAPTWKKERNTKGEMESIREIHDVNIFDVSTVTYPAYLAASTEARDVVARLRMFPEGAPADIRDKVRRPLAATESRAIAKFRDAQGAMAARYQQRFAKRGEFRSVLRSDGTLELVVYDIIGTDWWDGSGVNVKSVKEKIDAAGAFDRIQVRINSVGGDTFEGIAIFNLLRAQARPIECCVDGLAASAASIIAMAGDAIIMGANTMMMIHDPWCMWAGNAAELRDVANWLDKLALAVAQTYVERTGNLEDDVLALMREETWLNAQEAVAKGFATAIGTRADYPTPALPPAVDDPADGQDNPDERGHRFLPVFHASSPDSFTRQIFREHLAKPSGISQADIIRLARARVRARSAGLLPY
ncbi:MAG: head maturation protease, ClpP-related [Acidobacteriota bacterium]